MKPTLRTQFQVHKQIRYYTLGIVFFWKKWPKTNNGWFEQIFTSENMSFWRDFGSSKNVILKSLQPMVQNSLCSSGKYWDAFQSGKQKKKTKKRLNFEIGLWVWSGVVFYPKMSFWRRFGSSKNVILETFLFFKQCHFGDILE